MPCASSPSESLSPEHYTHRLVCTLLSTCGQYFSRGSVRRKLDAYLAHLQRYLLAKPRLPLDVEFDVQVWPPLRPKP